MTKLDIADIVANLIVIADNLDENYQIESNKIRSIVTQILINNSLHKSNFFIC